MSGMGAIGKEMYIDTGIVTFDSGSSEKEVSLAASIPVTHEPVIIVAPSSELGDAGSFTPDQYNINTFLSTSTPTHDGTNWKFKIKRSASGTMAGGYTKVRWKAIGTMNTRQVGAPVTPATEA